MLISYTSVTLLDSPTNSRWAVEGTLTEDDGSTRRYRYVFPTDTLEWRAAEYGIDPKDTATLLDIVLAEPHLTDADFAPGTHLYEAPDIETARRAHVARCAAVKWRHRIASRGAASPCQRIVQESPMDAEVIALKRELVSQNRASLAEPAPPVDRLAAFRAAVDSNGNLSI